MAFKRILKIILIIVVIAGIGFGGYYVWQKIKAGKVISPAALPSTGSEVTSPQQPSATNQPLLKIMIDKEIFDYWTNSQTGVVYYLDAAGQIFKISNGEPELVSSQTINNLNSVLASPDGTLLMIKFNYPLKPTFSIFDSITASWLPLPENTISAAWASWASTSQQVVYLENKDSSGRIAVLNTSSKKIKEIAKITQKDLNLYWIKTDELLLSPSPTADLASSLYSLNIAKKTIKPLIKDEKGLDIKWSKQGDIGLKLAVINNKIVLSVIDSAGNTTADLSFITLPGKCVFEQRRVYCAVPRDIPDGIKLPDDYYKKVIYFQDDFYLIDLDTGNAAPILIATDNIDAYRLTIENNQLLFINRYDQKLYSLKLNG